MITAAGINDQELAVAAELARVDDPAIAWGTRPGRRGGSPARGPWIGCRTGSFRRTSGRAGPAPAAAAGPWPRGNGIAGLMRPGVSMATRSLLGASTTEDFAIVWSWLPGCAGGDAGCSLLLGARRPRSPARRCRARSCSATSLSSLEIRSLRSDTLLAMSAAAWRTCASSGLALGERLALGFLQAGEPHARVVSRAVSARSLSPSVRMLVMTRTRSFSCSESATASPPSSGERGRQQHGAAHHRQRILAAASPSPAADCGPCAAWRPAAPRSSRAAASSVPRRCFSCASSSPRRGFDQAQLALALLDQLGRLHQPRVDALALGGDLVEVGLQLLAAPLRGLQPAAVGSRGACGPRPGCALPCAAASSGNAAMQAAAIAPAAISSSRRVRYVLAQSALDAMRCRTTGRQRIALGQNVCRNSLYKDHANCGMGELRMHCDRSSAVAESNQPCIDCLRSQPAVRAKQA